MRQRNARSVKQSGTLILFSPFILYKKKNTKPQRNKTPAVIIKYSVERNIDKIASHYSDPLKIKIKTNLQYFHLTSNLQKLSGTLNVNDLL